MSNIFLFIYLFTCFLLYYISLFICIHVSNGNQSPKLYYIGLETKKQKIWLKKLTIMGAFTFKYLTSKTTNKQIR